MKKKVLSFGDVSILSIDSPASFETHVKNMCVKNFRGLFMKKKSREYFKVFQVLQVGHLKGSRNAEGTNPRLEELLMKFKELFTYKLTDRMPPERTVDHAI